MVEPAVTVYAGDQQYPVYVGRNLLTDRALWEQYITTAQVLVVTNDQVAPLYLPPLKSVLGTFVLEVLPDGEEYKTLSSVQRLYETMLTHQFHRDALVIALGGGVIGDIAGFTAATYQRGISLLQLPTTLLAQVDSALGGKTAVNHLAGKNMIGAFHHPQAVLADVQCLDSLPARQVRAGLAEIIKYGLIMDAHFYSWLEDRGGQLLAQEYDILHTMITKSCCYKAKVIAQDEKEAGQRGLLNFGHTFGHAIEALLDYRGILHGEAVAIGMMIATYLSQTMGWLNADDVARVKKLLASCDLLLPLPPEITPVQVWEAMKIDKKIWRGTQRLILLRSIGEAVMCDAPPKEQVISAIAEMQV